MMYGLNGIEMIIAVMASMAIYYGMGFLMGKVMYKQKAGYFCDIGLTLVLVYTNVKQNIGWSRLIHALTSVSLWEAMFVIIVMLTTTVVVGLVMCAGTHRYNKLRLRKEVKWLI